MSKHPATSADGRGEASAQRFLLVLWLTTAFSMIMLVSVATLAALLARPIHFDAAFAAQFSIGLQNFEADQPSKTLAFEMGCLSVPLIVPLSYLLAGVVVGKWKDSLLPIAWRWAQGMTWLFVLWVFSAMVVPRPHLQMMPPQWLTFAWVFSCQPVSRWWRLLSLMLMGGFVLWLLWQKPSRRNLGLAFLAVVGVWILMVPSNIYSPMEVGDEWKFTYHLNILLHALSQVMEGHHMLVQFLHSYGGYIEFVAPVVALFPRRLETLLLVFPLLNVLAVGSLLLTARLVIRHPATLLVTGLALLCDEFMVSMTDHYYAYAPIRTLFPALGLLAATHYFRRPTRASYGIASALAALAPIWNLDTGVVLWLSWTATLMVREMGERNWVGPVRELGRQVLYPVIAGAIFLLYLRVISGLWPNPVLFFTFEKLTLGAGYFCLPIRIPDLWMIFLTIYLLGFVLAFSFYVQRLSTWRTSVTVMLALLGTGIFSYFIGRAVECNLVQAGYPAVLLVGIFLSETRTLVVLGKLPRGTWALLLPLTLLFGRWAFMSAIALPNMVLQSSRVISTWDDSAETPFRVNVAFVRQQIKPGDEVYMLSNYSGFYTYFSTTASPINLPAPGELLLSRDMDQLIAALEGARFPKLIMDESFFTYSNYREDICQKIRQAVATHYQVAATSPTGQVTLYVPRESAR